MTKFELILNDKSLYLVTDEKIQKYKELYPAVDVEQELRSMIGWCDSNPKNRKTRNGVASFITRWLKKAQDQGGSGYKRPVSRGLRDLSNEQMLTDVSWVPKEKRAAARAHMLKKYGVVYDG